MNKKFGKPCFTPHNIYDHYNTSLKRAEAEVVNQQRSGLSNGSLRNTADLRDEFLDLSFCRPTHPWKQMAEGEEHENYRSNAYELESLAERLRYATIFGVSCKNGRKVSGKKSDYPMFRQQLLKDYHAYWKSDPYLLF